MAVAFSAPQPAPASTDTNITRQMEAQMAEAARQVPLPDIVNWFEKRMVAQLYEMRDDPEFRTYSYIMTLDGAFVKICDSIGFGINASIQFSNPERMVHDERTGASGLGYGAVFTPQAEPNGLFMPEGLAATYILCLDSESGEVKPVYVEPEVIVSPFPLK
jgi:hypothetical protein